MALPTGTYYVVGNGKKTFINHQMAYTSKLENARTFTNEKDAKKWAFEVRSTIRTRRLGVLTMKGNKIIGRDEFNESVQLTEGNAKKQAQELFDDYLKGKKPKDWPHAAEIAYKIYQDYDVKWNPIMIKSILEKELGAVIPLKRGTGEKPHMKEGVSEGILTEAFKSTNMKGLMNRLRKHSDFRQGLGKMLYSFLGGVKLDQMTNDEVFVVRPVDAVKQMTKKYPFLITFYFDKNDKFIGATKGKKQLYSGGKSGMTGEKSASSLGRNYRNDRLGQKKDSVSVGKDYSQRGDRYTRRRGSRPEKYILKVVTPTSFKGLIEAAEYAFVITGNRESHGTDSIRADRKASKEGALAFTKASDVARDNINRYKAIVRDRVGSKDTIDKLVQSSLAHFGSMITKSKTQIHTHDTGEYRIKGVIGTSSHSDFRNMKGFVTVDAVSRIIQRMMSDYERYVSYLDATDVAQNRRSGMGDDEASNRFIDHDIKRNQTSANEYATEVKKYAQAITDIKGLG